MQLTQKLTKFLQSATQEEIKDFQFLLNHPEYEHRPVTMKEFLDNPLFSAEEDAPRENNRKILIEFFDTWNTFDEFEKMGKFDELLYVAGIGSGKCELLGTKVLMFDGSLKNIEDISIGDLVMGNDSKPRRVLNTHRGADEMYRIIPVKGEEKIVRKNHTLSLKRTNKGVISRNGSRDKKSGEIVNIDIEEYLKLSKKMKGILKLWRTGVSFSEKKVKIDPYFLGLWLGDGNNNSIGITTQDKEIKDYVYSEATRNGLVVTINQNASKTCPTYVLTTGTNLGKKNRNILRVLFKKYNLLGNKHIPLKYKTNSRKVRLELLAGLIDTDGYCGNNSMEFSNKNEVLIDDVVYLCRSLGFAAYKKERWTTCRGVKFQSFRVNISGELSEIPVLLKRKRCTIRKQKKNVLMTGFKIEKYGIGQYAGIEIDGNNLYLWDDFTVTHNSFLSSKSIQFILFRLLCLKNPQKFFTKAPGTNIAFINISKSFSQAKDVVFGEIKNRIDNSPWFQRYYMPDPRIKSVLRFPKNLYVLPLGSNEEAPLGYNIFGAVIDEASFHVSTKDKDYAEEAYHQIRKRTTSRFIRKGIKHGKLFIITSPRYINDFAERKFREKSREDIVLKKRVPLWEAMPKETFCGEKFDIGKYLDDFKGMMCPIEYEDDFKQNPERAMRDFGAQPSLAIQAFFRNHKIIEEKVNQERRHPWNDSKKEFYDWFKNRAGSPTYDKDSYFIHCDLALNRDGQGDEAGICCGKFVEWKECIKQDGKREKRPVIKILYMERIGAGPKSEILLSEIRERIYKIKEAGYNINKVFFDSWNSADSIQILKSTGVDAEIFSVDRNPEAYYLLKAAILDDRLDFYKYPKFVEELQQLEEVKGNKIDHSRLGKKDLSDAVASVVYHCSQGRPGVGVLIK